MIGGYDHEIRPINTIEAIQQFLEGTQAVAFGIAIITRTLSLGTEDPC